MKKTEMIKRRYEFKMLFFKGQTFFGKNNNFVKNFNEYASIHKRAGKKI